MYLRSHAWGHVHRSPRPKRRPPPFIELQWHLLARRLLGFLQPLGTDFNAAIILRVSD